MSEGEANPDFGPEALLTFSRLPLSSSDGSADEKPIESRSLESPVVKPSLRVAPWPADPEWGGSEPPVSGGELGHPLFQG